MASFLDNLLHYFIVVLIISVVTHLVRFLPGLVIPVLKTLFTVVFFVCFVFMIAGSVWWFLGATVEAINMLTMALEIFLIDISMILAVFLGYRAASFINKKTKASRRKS
jgi:hypothetical protein